MVIFPPENFLLEISHPHFCIFIIITVIINIAYVLKMLRLDLLQCIKNISSFSVKIVTSLIVLQVKCDNQQLLKFICLF